ncbi:MAG TPA: alkaline phosphatase family protein [Candidatus Cybelea sp.]|nr:alkaline phosphatase family protein [Candidatus Cybelea sp.]
MRNRAVRRYAAVLAIAIPLAACQSQSVGPNGLGFAGNGRGRPVNIHYAGERPSYAWRGHGRVKRRVRFATPIQHIFVISMENRTVENLFGGYYGQAWPGAGGGNWEDPNNFNLHDPNGNPTLTKVGLSQHFDPKHTHEDAWYYDSAHEWGQAPIHCPATGCPASTTNLAYAPPYQTVIYKTLVENWGFANNVLQANEGPSFVAHQYYIAGQSGGITGSASAPYAESENPSAGSSGDNAGNEAPDAGTSGCKPASDGHIMSTVNMSQPVASPTPLDNGPAISPCEEYPANILDEAVTGLDTSSPYTDWQYIAHSATSIWAAPLGVEHLFEAYHLGNKATQPFAVDPDAENFVLNVTGSTNPPPNPARPIATLTYVTPCVAESDHPLLTGTDDGPQWLAWVLNAIGNSSYWSSSTIFVTWDDWGGWYDNVPPATFRPGINAYNNADDPNEWGFRVPLIVISPYLKQRGYISSYATSGYQYRSQSVILQYVEATLGLPSLGADDMQDGQSDGLADMFDYGNQPLPWRTIPTSFTQGTCSGTGSGSYRRTHINGRRKP